jgi:1,4-alpha-glucan branching enzyme
MKTKLPNVRATGRRKLVPRTARKTHGKRTRFQMRTSLARDVFLAGDFNGWNPRSIPLQRESDGSWSVEIELPPGRHEYLFVVDGAWEPDPVATTASNPYGGVNSVVNIGINPALI